MDTLFLESLLFAGLVAAFSWLTLQAWRAHSPATARSLPLRFVHTFVTVYVPFHVLSYLETLHFVRTDLAGDSLNIRVAWSEYQTAVMFDRYLALVIAMITVVRLLVVRARSKRDSPRVIQIDR